MRKVKMREAERQRRTRKRRLALARQKRRRERAEQRLADRAAARLIGDAIKESISVSIAGREYDGIVLSISQERP